MLRGTMAFAIGALIVAWGGPPHDNALRERMLPVTMSDGRILHVAPTQVSVESWMLCVQAKACTATPKGSASKPDDPMTGVNWFDVNDYVAWANAQSGIKLRLPTSQEWRWLHRSLDKPKRKPLFTDPRLAWAANYGEDDGPGGPVRPVGSFGATPDGIADLNGNVWEWTATCAVAGFEGKDARNCPAFIAEGAHEAEIPVFLRNPAAGGCATGTPPTYLGLRLVADD